MRSPETGGGTPDRKDWVEVSPEWEEYSKALDLLEQEIHTLARKVEVLSDEEESTDPDIFVDNAARHTDVEKGRKVESLLELEEELKGIKKELEEKNMPMLVGEADKLLKEIRAALLPHIH